ncbi:LLM class flavin-dependent oxidoreductase [Conexibacter woesei]|uniref:LLM class flavin-dependent oxidoreductase n=1 Tax=Conexibacter woesei TaxID=191495 RepID=UPI0004024258|nr:LLM class flavin-dependent oxidoreductase [Conexibacter woesei]
MTAANTSPRRPLRIGVQLPEVERPVRFTEVMAMAQAAEESGFASVWVGDHLLYRATAARSERGPYEAWTMLSALAAVTERVELGPLVACAAFHPPAVLAKMAATIGEISSGRFVLGIGAGWNTEEFDAFGLPHDKLVGRFAEAFPIIRGLLAGERVSASGRYASVEDAVLLPEPPRVPIMIGSNGPRMLSIALPHADAWNTWWDDYGNTAEGFASLNARISAAAVEAGREPGDILRSACALVMLDESAPERPIIPEAPPITGTPTQIAARLRELHEAGADDIILVVSPITEASIRTLAEAVALATA